MNIEAIRASIDTAVKMRPPKFEEPLPPPSHKISKLEDYLLDSAFMRAELEEVVHNLDHSLALLRQKIEDLTGWEMFLPKGKPRDRITEKDMLRARREADRPTVDAGQEAKQLRESALRQITRFEFEAQWVISRAYSIISGS